VRTMTGLIAGSKFDVARLRRALDEGHLLATEVADHLVTRGLAFRDAHAAAGAIVRRAVERGVDLAALSIDEMRDASGQALVDESLRAVLDAARAVDRRDIVGGPARGRVVAAIEAAEQRLSKES